MATPPPRRLRSFLNTVKPRCENLSVGFRCVSLSAIMSGLCSVMVCVNSVRLLYRLRILLCSKVKFRLVSYLSILVIIVIVESHVFDE